MNNPIEIYRSQDGSIQLNVKLENETVWLSANQMAILFDRDAKTIRKHINNVFADGELVKESNTHFLRVVLFFNFLIFKCVINMLTNCFFITIKQ